MYRFATFLFPWGLPPVFFLAPAMTDQQPEQPVADTVVDTEQESQGESSACTANGHPAYYFDSHLFTCMHHPAIDSKLPLCSLPLPQTIVIEEAGAEEFYQITVNLPNKGGKVQVIVGALAIYFNRTGSGFDCCDTSHRVLTSHLVSFSFSLIYVVLAYV